MVEMVRIDDKSWFHTHNNFEFEILVCLDEIDEVDDYEIENHIIDNLEQIEVLDEVVHVIYFNKKEKQWRTLDV